MSSAYGATRPHQRTIPNERMRQLAQRLHNLGPRPLFEFLREIDAGADLFDRLERYAVLDPIIVAALAGDRLAGPFAIDGGRR